MCDVQAEAVNVCSSQLLSTALKFLPIACPREVLFLHPGAIRRRHISELNGTKPSPAELVRVIINPQPLYNVGKK